MTTFTYNCAQLSTRQKKPKKVADKKDQHDKDCMHTFDCDGWLTIWACPDTDDLFVRLKHKDNHVPYFCIDVPADVQQFVKDNPRLRGPEVRTTMTLKKHCDSQYCQLWNEILKTYPTPNFSRRAVHTLYMKSHQSEWKRDDDEIKSAKKLLEEFSQKDKGSPYHIEPIPMPDNADDGYTAIAFSMPNLIRKWGGKIVEIALDSTCMYPFLPVSSVNTVFQSKQTSQTSRCTHC